MVETKHVNCWLIMCIFTLTDNSLITSDQMARGIDIPSVDYVISYDLPGYTKTYIHRIGRCARAGREGQAVSLIQQDQVYDSAVTN